MKNLIRRLFGSEWALNIWKYWRNGYSAAPAAALCQALRLRQMPLPKRVPNIFPIRFQYPHIAAMSSTLLYNPLNTEAAEFRLLTILPSEDDEIPVQCSLETCSLSPPPPYHALSYAWGNPGVAAGIIIDDTSFQATHNLEQALRAIRYRLENDLRMIFRTNRTDDEEAAAGVAELRLSTSAKYRI